MTLDQYQYAAVALAAVTGGMALILTFGLGWTRSNALAGIFSATVGLAVATMPVYTDRVDTAHPQTLARLQGLLEAAAVSLAGLYMLSLLATSQLRGPRATVVRTSAIVAIALGPVLGVLTVAFPAQHLNDYELSLLEPGALSTPGFWVFAGFWLVAIVPFSLGWGGLAMGGLDHAEERRALAFMVASAFVIAATVAPPIAAGLCIATWICLCLWGQLELATMQAERSVFLSRFLSPQVSQLVASRGMVEAMKPHQAELTVVCADLRGFTSYSEGVPSQAVVDLLADYYEAAGGVVAKYGGTITNYAGDGILILVGAPIADPDHAATGLRLARELLAAVEPVVARWETRHHPLGLGVGVASGRVTVGAISAETRMEYTAIGMPVNLAARLCSHALAGEVLLDASAAQECRAADLEPRGEMQVKGFADPQLVYAVGKG
ncbi:adenylate/guanylate cyclase domain-containing protein [Nocardioides jiangxiensis]|uniref:Adenylate/guanylate cyclase domain-containing protein n=1 Tax=Nocardioides jiangxiensis TaxID=3064524 RepID=A0ABT9B4C4_9ACTN|nr:adenylate/guanylate cyclase domain-containing protein [Nocardioides sp. WY-20]MDO7869573.1 adenylate/guanylate cyclase domain-containing protein [Nocardioides sp. WY-20]